jgi:surface carbohydrate biosynthesis protein
MATFCIPCEVYLREFDAKLLLATRLAVQYGHEVLIGYDKYFTYAMSEINNPCLIDKSLSSIMYTGRIHPAKINNGKVMICDEEGFNTLGFKDTKSFYARVDQRSIDEIDLYAAWGNREIDFYGTIKGFRDKALPLGNSRSDLLNTIGKKYFEPLINSLRNIFGPYVLVSDNFAVELLGINKMPRYDISDDKYQEIQREFDDWRREGKMLRDVLSDIVEVAVQKLPDLQFVIRPHPAANPIWWHNRFGQYRNCHIIHRHPVEPWIHGSNAVINMGCTVGFQSIVAGKQTIEVAKKDYPLHGTSSRIVKQHVYTGIDLVNQLISGQNKDFLQETDRKYLDYSWTNTGSLSSTHILAKNFHQLCRDVIPAPHQEFPTGPFVYDKAKWSELPLSLHVKNKVKQAVYALGLKREPSVTKISKGVWRLSC